MVGDLPCQDLTEIGAAYIFYLCLRNRCINGYKRSALDACVVFLRLNGIESDNPPANFGGLCTSRRGSSNFWTAQQSPGANLAHVVSRRTHGVQAACWQPHALAIMNIQMDQSHEGRFLITGS